MISNSNINNNRHLSNRNDTKKIDCCYKIKIFTRLKLGSSKKNGVTDSGRKIIEYIERQKSTAKPSKLVRMRILRRVLAETRMIQRRRIGLPHERSSALSPQLPRRLDNNLHTKMEGSSTVYSHPDITCVAEYIKNKLYFATLATGRREARNTSDINLFSVDDELVYHNFYNDFGPLNLACLYKYCCKVNKKLRSPANKNKQIVHYTSQYPQKKANAAYLITSYAILYLKRNPRDAYATLIDGINQPLRPFQDASMGVSIYSIRLQDCLNAIHKAAAFGFFNFDDFDLAEYEKYEQMRNGDLNWMLPQKFLAFTGPSTEVGTAYHPPERYIDYFVKNGVTAVVRLNKKTYDASRFTRAGIDHYDMFMPDGSAPPKHILNEFLRLAESTSGPIAVHCKAGLGRTGSLIAAYLVKHYRMSAREAIAWMRICRPGSVIGHQQAWLESMENELWRSGQHYRLKHHGDGDMIVHHKRGIYSIAHKLERRIHAAIGRDMSISKKRERCKGENIDDSGCGMAMVGDQMWKGNNAIAANKITKPGITRLFGKFRMPRARTPPNSDVRSPSFGRRLDGARGKMKISETDNRTQGDRLNEIKAGRHKFC